MGCGFDDNPHTITRTHAGSYYKNQKTELVALCDIDENKLKKYGRKYSVKGLYKNSTSMFKNENIDCVSICTLVDSHLDLVKEAAIYGVKGIFVEKPISNSLRSTQEIIKICKKNKIKLTVDHFRRFDPFYQSIRDFIKNEKLGDVQHVNVYYGSGIANTGSHVFDLLSMFFGEVACLKGNFSENLSPHKNDPNIDVFLKFKNGIKCVIQALNLRNYGICEFDIFGNKGRIRLDLLSDKVAYFKKSNKNFQDYRKLMRTNMPVKRSSKSGTALGIQNLVDCMWSGKNPLCTGEDGYKSLELIIGSIQSSIKKRKIILPLDNNSYKIKSK